MASFEVTGPPDREYILATLSFQEAYVIRALTGSVAGAAAGTIREITDALWEDLVEFFEDGSESRYDNVYSPVVGAVTVSSDSLEIMNSYLADLEERRRG